MARQPVNVARVAPAEVPPNPAEVSSDYTAMLGDWNLIETILGGADAVRTAGTDMIPKLPHESQLDYDYRLANLKFTNIYEDIVTSLASKPFAEECSVADDASERIKTLAEDIDGRGNNLHVFASNTFFHGINYAIDWILVDYTKAPRPTQGSRALTQSEEAAARLRPYWVHIPAKRMIAPYSDMVDGIEQLVHCRIEENRTERQGWREVIVPQIRIFNREPIYEDGKPDPVGYEPATWELWQKRDGAWVRADGGPVSIGIIPIVPFATGRRKGSSWQFVPPMRSAAQLQREHCQAETNLKHIKEHAAYPMLSASGVAPAKLPDGSIAPVPIGPKAVLYAPPHPESGQHGEWKFIEPSADSLRFLAEEVKNTEEQMRELGRQPLTATAGITVVVAGLASQKASSAVQAWALNLKDALEQAFKITEMWLNESKPTTVKVHTDFALDPNDKEGRTFLMEMRKNGDLSREDLWEEAQRRGDLRPDFDPETAQERLDEEADEKIEEDDMAAARMIEIQRAKQTPPPGTEDDPPETLPGDE